VAYQKKKKPADSWAVPFVLGHKYKIHWGATGLDFDSMQIEVSSRYKENDPGLYFVHNFTDIRAEMDISLNDGELIPNDTISAVPQNWRSGQHVLYEDMRIKEFHFVINGAYPTPGVMEAKRNIKFVAHRCSGGECPVDAFIGIPIEIDPRYWSDANAWATTNVVPMAGDDVLVEAGWNMHLDLEEATPIYNKIEINGRLTLAQGMDHYLKAKIILIRVGELRIGTEGVPYTKNAVIELMGEKESDTIAIEDQGVEAGNKIIANLGKITMYGKQRSFKLARLTKPAAQGDTSISIVSD